MNKPEKEEKEEKSVYDVRTHLVPLLRSLTDIAVPRSSGAIKSETVPPPILRGALPPKPAKKRKIDN